MIPASSDPVSHPLVSIIMGSQSDWETMRHAQEILNGFGVPHECLVVSAHRTPAWLTEFASQAEGRGIEVIIAGAGGAARGRRASRAHRVRSAWRAARIVGSG